MQANNLHMHYACTYKNMHAHYVLRMHEKVDTSIVATDTWKLLHANHVFYSFMFIIGLPHVKKVNS